MADSRARDALFRRTDIALADKRLRELIKAAADTFSIGAVQLLRDHYRDQSEPRHPVTRWA